MGDGVCARRIGDALVAAATAAASLLGATPAGVVQVVAATAAVLAAAAAPVHGRDLLAEQSAAWCSLYDADEGAPAAEVTPAAAASGTSGVCCSQVCCSRRASRPAVQPAGA